MITKIKKIDGASTIEYIVLIVIVLAGLYAMKDTISRGIFAKFKQSGDSFGFGRQYDAKRTTVCKQDTLRYTEEGVAILGNFYDEDCYQARVHRLLNEGGCPQCNPGETACFACEDAIKKTCGNEYCNH